MQIVKLEAPEWTEYIFASDCFWKSRYQTLFDSSGKKIRAKFPEKNAEYFFGCIGNLIREWLHEKKGFKLTQSEYAIDSKTAQELFPKLQKLDIYIKDLLQWRIKEIDLRINLLKKRKKVPQEKIERLKSKKEILHARLVWFIANDSLEFRYSLTRCK